MSLANIKTERLILIPITLEMTISLLNGSNKEIKKLGIKADKKWPTEDTMDILPIIQVSLEKDKVPSGFETWMIVRKDDMRIIGDAGFHGKPDEKGEVEIGYGLVDHERKRGFGFETAKAISDWAFSNDSVKVLKADCLIDNVPSIRILEKIGFNEVNRDKELIYWRLDRPVK